MSAKLSRTAITRLLAAGSISVLAIGLSFPAVAQTQTPTTGQTTTAPTGTTGTAEVGQTVQAAQPAPAQQAQRAADSQTGDIIVTAQKREESLSRVPMSITALSANQLADRRISSPEDLAKAVPGFQFTPSVSGTPVYTIRGVGFNDSSPAARPAVSVYLDQAPLPFSVESQGAALDIERVEVLKGPQGTLFGQNATGGAINYIAAKPTSTFQAGGSASYGSYNYNDVQAFISGPISDTLEFRVAAKHTGRDGWQISQRRPDDRMGSKDVWTGRAQLEWRPSSDFDVNLNINGFTDHSESQAAQFFTFVPTTAAFASRIPTIYSAPASPGNNDRVADWTPGVDYHHRDSFIQANLHAEYDLSHSLQLTSITSVSHYRGNYYQDPDGSEYNFFQLGVFSKLRTFSQEVRLSGNFDNGLRFIVGGNYEHDSVDLSLDETLHSTASFALSALPGGPAQFTHVIPQNHERTNSYAGFANLDYDLSSQFTFHGGIRYTRNKTNFSGCNYDGGDGAAAAGFTIVQGRIRTAAGLTPITIPPGGCITFNTVDLAPKVVNSVLDEHNWSWRAGIDFKPSAYTMFYANLSKGYKIGSFPLIGTSFSSQYAPAVQESVLAGEVGFKTSTSDRTLRLEGAGFYYDYRNKQVFGSFNDPTFGALKREVNVPKSALYGGELSVTWAPSPQFTLTGGGTYIHSKILGSFLTQDLNNATVNVGGESFPFTPEWQGIIDAEYRVPVGHDGANAFFGISGRAQSGSNAELGGLAATYVNGYGVLDLRVGVRGADSRWSVTLFAENVTNTYYWTNATKYHDTFARYTGMPQTFGITVAFKTH